MFRSIALGALVLLSPLAALRAQPDVDRTPLEGIPEPPALVDFKPLPAEDAAFSAELASIVEAVGLADMTPAAKNPDEEDEWSSICLVDISDREHPRVAGWKADNFIYPASTYKMYVLGEAIRQFVAGEIKLDDIHVVKEHNVRSGSHLTAGQEVTTSEILRLMVEYSDNCAANEAIDLVDRRRASALMHALGCKGSEVTRKYLSRNLEDDGFANVVSTTTNARHAATYLWAVETGAIGGGRGRGLIKSYLALEEMGMNRFKGGLPKSATVFSKTGWWNVFTSEAAIVEDGDVHFILAAFTAQDADIAVPKLADLARRCHMLLSGDEAAATATAAPGTAESAPSAPAESQ